MKRFVLAVVVALAATACSGGADVAATVNGVDIEVATVEGLVDNGGEELTEEQFRSILTALVQWNAIADAAESEYGIAPSEDEVTAYADELLALQGAGMAREDFLAAQGVTEAGFILSADRLLIEEQLLAELESEVEVPTTEEAQQMVVDDPKSWTLVCAAHILVATEDEAAAVQERLGAGEDFAAIAIELSLDTGSGPGGGDLGCAVPAGYVPEFADATLSATLGDVTDPVETQFGFHLIRVDSRTEATAEEIQETMREAGRAEVAADWFLAAVVDAEIEIDPSVGTWSVDPAPTILAPVS
ncbi:MAG: peptidylprolyl isomerase [Acidimicrobiia bacterium]|nr:peptidylprolyl isomerase [Acidimicrobiia bacterium]